MISDFTRGGQIEMHRFRMIGQVLKKIIIIYVVLTFLIFGFKSYLGDGNYNNYQNFFIYEISKIDYALSSMIDKYNRKQQYNPHIMFKGMVFEDSYLIANSLKYKKNSIYVVKMLKRDLKSSLLIALGLIGLIIIYLIYFGRKKVQLKNLGKAKIFNAIDANSYLKKNNISSDYKVGDLHLVKDKETSHILFTGSTGSGKSNAMFHLIPQIRDSGSHIIIVDFTGEMIKAYYNKESGDKIINPFEPIGTDYDFLSDAKDQNSLSTILNALFSNSNTYRGDSFWDEAAKSVFKDLINYCVLNDLGIDRLYNLAHKEKLEKLHIFLDGSSAANILDPKNDKTSMSIRTHMMAYTGFLEFLSTKNDETISIKSWFQDIQDQNNQVDQVNRNNRKPILFLHASPSMRSRVKILYSMIIDLIISNIMNLGPDANRRIWVILDELPALSYLPSLPIALSEGRKYGCCIMAGMQSIHQLHDIYGSNISKTMMDQFGTKFVFRTEDEIFGNYIASIFGKNEYEELKETISYGANDMRDGVSLNRDKREKPLVSLSDLSSLKDLEAFVKLPDQNMRIVRLQMKYKN
jgi:type IV conjugative transfer system coupling protein TraD